MAITVGATKGGVGKTTIACNLAVTAAPDGKSVLLVGADTQASSSMFRAARSTDDTDDISMVQITTPTIHGLVMEATEQYR